MEKPSDKEFDSPSILTTSDSQIIERETDTMRKSLKESGVETFCSDEEIATQDAENIANHLTKLQTLYKNKGETPPIRNVSPEDIIQRSKNGHFLLRDKADNRIVACIFLYKYMKLYEWHLLYERVTLRKDTDFRHNFKKEHPDCIQDMSIGQYLMSFMTLKVGNEALVSVTSSPHIIANNKALWYYILSRDALPPQLEQLLMEYKDLGDPSYDEKSFCLNEKCFRLLEKEKR